LLHYVLFPNNGLNPDVHHSNVYTYKIDLDFCFYLSDISYRVGWVPKLLFASR